MSETREFFAAVWPGGLEKGDSLLLWTRQGHVSRWADSTEEAAVIAGDLCAEKDVYVGVGAGPAPADRSESRRLKACEVRTLPGHVADLDVAGAGHKQDNLFASREEVLQAVERLELQPSLMVASGGGLQLWWLYREPWVLETDDAWSRGPWGFRSL